MKLLVQENGTSKSERRTLNLVSGTNMTVTVTDDPVGNQVDIQFDSSGGAGTPSGSVVTETAFGQASAVGASTDYSRGDHTHGTPAAPAGGTPATSVTDETTFGISTAVGVHANYARQDHTHGSPTDPVTAHAAAGDPHTGYRLESADHTHQSTGAQAGTLDHGLSLSGLTDNDHTQYILHSIADANGDLLLASAADNFARLGIGANATVLTSNGTTASWQTPGAASHPAFISHLRFASHG